MKLFKRGKTWSANFWVKGRHIQRSTHFRNQRKAEKTAMDWREAIIAGDPEPWKKPTKPGIPTFAKFVEQFREDIKAA